MPELTIAGILGFLAPLLVAIVNQPKFSPLVRRIIAIVVSVLLALVAMFVSGTFIVPTDPRGVGITILAVIGIAQIAYGLIWKPSGLTDQLEAATSKKETVLPGQLIDGTNLNEVSRPGTYRIDGSVDPDSLDQPGPDHRKE